MNRVHTVFVPCVRCSYNLFPGPWHLRDIAEVARNTDHVPRKESPSEAVAYRCTFLSLPIKGYHAQRSTDSTEGFWICR